MSVVLRDKNDKRQLITKGAVDEIMFICSYIDMNGEVIELNKELKEKVKKCHLYSKLSPLQKQRIVRIYQEQGISNRVVCIWNYFTNFNYTFNENT